MSTLPPADSAARIWPFPRPRQNPCRPRQPRRPAL